jgi:hypothetical protein
MKREDAAEILRLISFYGQARMYQGVGMERGSTDRRRTEEAADYLDRIRRILNKEVATVPTRT